MIDIPFASFPITLLLARIFPRGIERETASSSFANERV